MIDEIQKMYDSFPDTDVFDESQTFDSFLVGDGSAELMQKMGRNNKSSSNQLIGVYEVSDLKNPSSESTIVSIDDTSEFECDQVLIEDSDEYFFKIKKAIFEKYEYLEKKSKEFAGRPIRERDLVLTNDDGYLLHYIKEKGYSYDNVISALSQLSAYKDMGLSDVVFYSVDMCPVCSAFEGSYYRISELISLIGSGQVFIHKGAECNFVPVFRSRKGTEFTITAYIHDILYRNLPIEFEEFITEDLSKSLEGFRVHFKDFSKIEDIPKDVVVRLVGKSIEVHNGYVERFSPFDFLKEWLDLEKVQKENIEINLEDQEVFYLNGKKVVESGGIYIDISTGKEVELFDNDEKDR